MAKGMNRIYLCTIHGTTLSAAQYTHTQKNTIEWQGNDWITMHQFKWAAEGSQCDQIWWTVPAHACRNSGNLWEMSVKTDRYPNQESFRPTSSLDPKRQVKFNMVTILTHHCTNYDLYSWGNCCLLSLNKQIKNNCAPVPNYIPHHEDVYGSGCCSGHTSAIYVRGNNQLGEGVGLNFPNTSQKSYCVKGWGWGVDTWQFFLWPQYKHLQFSINIILK